MRKSLAVTSVFVLFAGFVFVDCGKYTGGKQPQLEVKVGGQSMAVKYEFPLIKANQPSVYVDVTVENFGNSKLRVDKIYFEPGGNPFVSIEWTGSVNEKSFPVTIEPDEVAPGITMRIIYDPESDAVDVTKSVLVIETNDYKNNETDNGIFKIEFGLKPVGPKLLVNRSSIIYSCVTGCTTENIIVDNEGTDILVVSSIEMGSPTTEFDFVNKPMLPIEVGLQGEPSYAPVTFGVRYCPGDSDYNDTNELKLSTNDFTEPDGIKRIKVSVTQSPALLSFTTDSPFGYLDFSGIGSHKINIYNKQASECDDLCPNKGKCCGCPIQIQGTHVEPPDAAPWYKIMPQDPSSGQAWSLPRALKGGTSIDFEVKYEVPAGQSGHRNGVVCIDYVAPLAGPQSYCLSAMAQSQCEFSIAPVNQVLQFNSSSPADIKEKAAVLVNNGTADCKVTHVDVTDKWGAASEDFSLKKVIPGDTKIPEFGLLPVWVKYSPHSESPNGFLNIEYEDPMVGITTTSVTLLGTKKQDCSVPVANPGSTSDYASAVAGQSLSLNGCASSQGSCGHPIYDNGYVWYLLDKPDGSTSMLNEEGGCIASFLPDKAGTYTVGLVVYDATDNLQSALATVDIVASEAQDN